MIKKCPEMSVKRNVLRYWLPCTPTVLQWWQWRIQKLLTKKDERKITGSEKSVRNGCNLQRLQGPGWNWQWSPSPTVKIIIWRQYECTISCTLIGRFGIKIASPIASVWIRHWCCDVRIAGSSDRLLHVRFPRGYRLGVDVGRVTSPQRLDKHGRRNASTYQMLLPLLLLHLQSETRSEDALRAQAVTGDVLVLTFTDDSCCHLALKFHLYVTHLWFGR